MIRVISRIPQPREYRGKCTKCGTVVAFERADAKLEDDIRLIGLDCKTGRALVVACPDCSTRIYHYDPK